MTPEYAALMRDLLARAVYSLDRGWTAAAMDAIGRAAYIQAEFDPPLFHVTMEPVTEEERRARISPKISVKIWRLNRENPQ